MARYRGRGGGGGGGGSFGLGIMMIYIGVFIGSIVALALAPTFMTYCTAAGNATSDTVVKLFYNTILPILYAVCCIAGLAGATYKLFKS
jgi:hypothetical protein